MSKHALVVDDDQAILDDVKDRLESLGHTCDCVSSQNEAHALIRKRPYDYVLLDLEIPVQYGKPTRIQNGQNLLRQIRSTKGYENTPVIVITAHGHDSPDLATEVMRGHAADDFVRKPFPEAGHTLEKAVTEALTCGVRLTAANRPQGETAAPRAPSLEPQAFQHGELVFLSDRVELCGVKILGPSGLGHSRKMLDLLKERRPDGRFVRMGAEDIAVRIDRTLGINTITGCAATIRKNICERLKKDPQNIECGDGDVLIRDEQGYHLNDEKITVRHSVAGTCADVPPNVPASVPDVPSMVRGDISDLNERQKWILEEAQKGGEVRRSRVEEKFGVSGKTAKRDFSELSDLGLVVFVRRPHPGHYVRKK